MAETTSPRPAAATTRASRRGRWKRGCAASALSLVFALACAELVVRARFGAPRAERLPLVLIRAHPTRGWEMVPDETHYTYEHEVRVNSLGLRGEELAVEKDGEQRVLCLGDSLVYGQGVADDETIPAHLEHMARARRPFQPFRAINGGLRAYATHQELALFEELGPRVQPDVVALFWYHNDFEERDLAQTYEKLRASGPIVFDVSAPMQGWTKREWQLEQLLRRSALVMEVYDVVRTLRSSPPDTQFVETGFAKLEHYLDRYVATAKRLNCRALFVLVPDATSIPGPGPFDVAGRRALEIARSKGLETVDPLPQLRELYQQQHALPIIPYDGHYESPANEAIARAVLAAFAP